MTQGTKEWADSNINIFHGCSNDCTYCYAKRMAIRFGRKTKENWKEMELNEKAYNKGYKLRKGRIMFPTSHDITIKNIHECITVLKKILEAGNNVLITTKPHPACIYLICEELEKYKKKMQFRFTITSNDDSILKEFEPNAPDYDRRRACVRYAHKQGWQTSISIEPFLDEDPIPLIRDIEPFVNETIWIGIMSGQSFKHHSDHNLKKVVQGINTLPIDVRVKIRLKDSIRNRGYQINENDKEINGKV